MPDSLTYAYPPQILSTRSSSVDVLDLFRHLMVDIISTTVFGSRPGALDNLAMGIQDILSQAVRDFPTRGIVVSVHLRCRRHRT